MLAGCPISTSLACVLRDTKLRFQMLGLRDASKVDARHHLLADFDRNLLQHPADTRTNFEPVDLTATKLMERADLFDPRRFGDQARFVGFERNLEAPLL